MGQIMNTIKRLDLGIRLDTFPMHRYTKEVTISKLTAIALREAANRIETVGLEFEKEIEIKDLSGTIVGTFQATDTGFPSYDNGQL